MTPDLIILNGRVIHFDDRPSASAIAIAGDRILTLGDTSDLRDLAGPATQVFDAQGGTIMPGLVDSHVHLFIGSVGLDLESLAGQQGRDAAQDALTRAATKAPDDRVLLVLHSDYDLFGDGRPVTRQDLDTLLPGRAFALMADDFHTLWANTAALEAAGILNGSDAPAGSEVVMADDGTASGMLLESAAMAPVLALTRYGGRDLEGYVTGRDPVSGDAMRAVDADVIARGLSYCAGQGITGLHNMDGNVYQLELLQTLMDDGRLPIRVQVPMHLKGTDSLERLDEAAEMHARWSGEWLWSGRVKMFQDGVIEAETAQMKRPYPSGSGRGDDIFPPDVFNEACVRADAMGLQISVHAIGDRAIARTLDGYDAARTANGFRDSRHRIEHLEVLDPADLPRLKDLGVVASFQPGHAPWGHMFSEAGIGKHLHPDQPRWVCAWNDVRAAGIPMIFSTDWPVIGVEVMPNIRAAVAPAQLPAPWVDQTQSVMDTLAAYSRDAAWVEFREDRKGRLKPGYLADIAVFDTDLQTTAPDRIEDASCVLTVCGGRVTHRA